MILFAAKHTAESTAPAKTASLSAAPVYQNIFVPFFFLNFLLFLLTKPLFGDIKEPTYRIGSYILYNKGGDPMNKRICVRFLCCRDFFIDVYF